MAGKGLRVDFHPHGMQVDGARRGPGAGGKGSITIEVWPSFHAFRKGFEERRRVNTDSRLPMNEASLMCPHLREGRV